jgi:hypothetical protein
VIVAVIGIITLFFVAMFVLPGLLVPIRTSEDYEAMLSTRDRILVAEDRQKLQNSVRSTLIQAAAIAAVLVGVLLFLPQLSWPVIVAVVGGLILLCLSVLVFPRFLVPTRTSEDYDAMSSVDRIQVAIARQRLENSVRSTLIQAIAGAALLVGALFFYQQQQIPPQAGNLEQRVAILSSTLQTAARSISDTEKEIEARRQLVEKLARDQRRYDDLLKLNKPQIEAITAQLQGELDKAQGRARLEQYGLVVVGALLGVFVQWFFTWLFRLLRVRKRNG